mgnify:CR=1 FL=1
MLERVVFKVTLALTIFKPNNVVSESDGVVYVKPPQLIKLNRYEKYEKTRFTNNKKTCDEGNENASYSLYK